MSNNHSYTEHPTTPGVMFASNTLKSGANPGRIVKSTDYGSTWDLQNPFHAGYGSEPKLAIFAGNPNIMYRVGTQIFSPNYGIFIYKTIDGGANWTGGLNASLKAAYTQLTNFATSVWLSPTDPNYLMISLSGMEPGKRVFYTTDGGSSWVNFSTDLPELPVNKVLCDVSTNTFYAATDIGVYFRTSSMSSWAPFNKGMTKVMVTDIELNPITRELVASTYGRGLYKACLDCSGASELVISDAQNWGEKIQVCGGLKVASGGNLTVSSAVEIPYDKNITIDGGILTLKSGSVIRNKAGVNWTGTITVKNGGKLTIDANAILAIGGSGKINADAGAIIEVINTGSILLNDQSSLRVNGNITLNGMVNISGSGYIYLNGNIDATTGSILNIAGSGKTNKLLEVQKSMVFSANFTSVTVKNGKIVMANTSSEMIFTSPTSNVTLENVLTTSASGSYLACNGVRMNTIKNITITNSTFEKVKYGLYLMRSYTDPVATISGSTFQNCETGLLVYHSGVTINGCTFNNNTNYGLATLSIEKASSLTNCQLNSNTTSGLNFTGTSTGTLSAVGSTFNNNGTTGAEIHGPFTFTMSCCYANNNGSYGVFLVENAILDADGSDLHGNKIAIYGYNPTSSTGNNGFILKYGKNDLRDNGASGSYCIYGSFKYFVGGATKAVEVNQNYWKTGGGAPVINTDYALTGSSAAIYLQDPSPLSVFALCVNSNAPTTGLTGTQYAEAYSYQTVTTSLGSTPLNTAVETILNDDPQKATVYDNFTRFELLNEVLANKLRKPNEGEKWYFEKAYGEMKSQIGKPTKDGEPLFKSPELSEARNKAKTMGKNRKAWKGQKETAEFRALVDEASLLAFEGRYDEAIALLQNNRASLATDDAAYLDIIICHLNVDKTVAEGNDSLLVDEEYALCEKCGENLKSGNTNEGSSSGAEQAFADFRPEIGIAHLVIIPNPVNGSSNIEITLPGQGVTAKVVVFNSAGQQVLDQVINTGYSKIEVNNRRLPTGLYLVNLVVDGQTVAAEKMMVME